MALMIMANNKMLQELNCPERDRVYVCVSICESVGLESQEWTPKPQWSWASFLI